MKETAADDREANSKNKPAIHKLKMSKLVFQQLMKKDLHDMFLDGGVLSGITEWLAPLPDKSLPSLQIRNSLLKILGDFKIEDSERLKSSGVGKAVMYLYKHPKETRENKERAGRLVNEWSRPIFNLSTDYQRYTKEDREARDYDQLATKRRKTVEEGMKTPRRDLDKSLAGKDKALRPGEVGWVARARVPMPSSRDYVIRPKSNVDETPGEGRTASKKELNRYEKAQRKAMEKKKHGKQQRAHTVCIEGNRMPL